jgi:hypothetical protein
MNKQTLLPHEKKIHASRDAVRLGGFGSGRGAKAKTGADDKAHLWESAFHAERGCLDGGLPLRYTGPVPRH